MFKLNLFQLIASKIRVTLLSIKILPTNQFIFISLKDETNLVNRVKIAQKSGEKNKMQKRINYCISWKCFTI